MCWPTDQAAVFAVLMPASEFAAVGVVAAPFVADAVAAVAAVAVAVVVASVVVPVAAAVARAVVAARVAAVQAVAVARVVAARGIVAVQAVVVAMMMRNVAWELQWKLLLTGGDQHRALRCLQAHQQTLASLGWLALVALRRQERGWLTVNSMPPMWRSCWTIERIAVPELTA